MQCRGCIPWGANLLCKNFWTIWNAVCGGRKHGISGVRRQSWSFRAKLIINRTPYLAHAEQYERPQGLVDLQLLPSFLLQHATVTRLSKNLNHCYSPILLPATAT